MAWGPDSHQTLALTVAELHQGAPRSNRPGWKIHRPASALPTALLRQ